VAGRKDDTVAKQARVRSRELRRAQAAIVAQRGRNRRRLAVGGVAVILGLLIAIVAVVADAVGDRNSGGTSGALVTPARATATGALVAGQDAAPVRLEVYLDYLCPFCGRFERANSTEIDRLVADGTVRLELHPLAFLDRMSAGSRYSTRAANAVATVADRAPDKLPAFNRALFENQPAEGTEALSDDEIAVRARQAGVPEQVVAAFGERIFEPWIERSTTAAFDSGITGTPTVKINGTPFAGDLYTAGPLTRALTAAAGR
jgi:protein-disulfide isomerase